MFLNNFCTGEVMLIVGTVLTMLLMPEMFCGCFLNNVCTGELMLIVGCVDNVVVAVDILLLLLRMY